MEAGGPPALRLVMALDYGTTFTGFCYAVVGADGQNDFLVENWPSAGSQKVPSQISYSPAPNGEHQWGFDIAPGSLNITWTKLELDDQKVPEELSMILRALDAMKDFNPAVIEQEHGLPSYPALDPVDIAADYLRYVREYVRDHPPRQLPTALLSTLPIDLVVTVPAIWSNKAKNRTFQAISRAGFDKTNFPRLQDVFLVAEPEAAALYTIKTQFEIEGDKFMNPGDCFVLCDAGGGTVDLISYCVKQTIPSIELEEATWGSGDKCGATFIDRNFRKWLRNKLGPDIFKSLTGKFPEWDIGSHYAVGPDLQRLMQEFENIRERFISPDDQADEYLNLPEPFNLLDDPARGISRGELRITGRDLEEMFEPCVTKVVDLVRRQIGLVSRSRNRVKYVFLTGGFGQSQYLYAAVDRLTDPLGIQTKRPGPLEPHKRNEQRNHCWSAVVRGAALRGLERGHNLIQMRICRKCYGISISEPFSFFKHSEQDAYCDLFDGKKKASGQMKWLLKTGDALPASDGWHASTKFRTKFGQHDPRIFTICVVELDSVEAHQRYEDIQPDRMVRIELQYDLGTIDLNRFQTIRPSGREMYFYTDLELELRLETHLVIEIKFQGETITRYP